jgi:2-polyprenyl-3-methyl-5-hydroxy-6-metoxy-1,4-benzoquinol methylase
MSFKQTAIRMLNPHSRLFKVLYQLRHPVKGIRKLRIILSKSSIFSDEDDLHGCSLLPTELLTGALSVLTPTSVLDVGCGTGKSLDWFLAQGIDSVGLEGSSMAIAHALNPLRIQKTDLNHSFSLGRTFDLVWCFEVAEHIHPDFTETFVSSLIRHSDTILLSAAHPGQGGVGHFNEQPRSYWIQLFASLGYFHDDEARYEVVRDWTWFPENIFLFRKVRPNR